MLNSTYWVRMSVTVFRYQGDEMTGSAEYSKDVEKLMRMTKNIKRARTQPFWNPADEKAPSEDTTTKNIPFTAATTSVKQRDSTSESREPIQAPVKPLDSGLAIECVVGH